MMALDEDYLTWLYSKVASPRARSKTQQFYSLIRILYTTEFEYLVSGDDNRAEDGCGLRIEFMDAAGYDEDPMWLSEGCSVLEMLIAFSRRAAFETEDPPRYWFWIMMKNLGLDGMNDAADMDIQYVGQVLDTFVFRRYDELGHGGLFPLRETEFDQRYIEVWYQFSEYVYQNNIV